MIYQNIEEMIGRTPVLLVETINNSQIFVKLEGCNPAGSIKDRVAHEIIDEFAKEGKLKNNPKIVEATSGNTGIGLALICACRHIPLTILMPENMSKERIMLMEAYGAKVILTPKAEGMEGAEKRAKAMEKDGYLFANQFGNTANLKAHEKTTSQEIIKDFASLDYFVAGIGTAGTLIGNAIALKKAYPSIKIIGVEPKESPILEGGKPGPHLIQGIGANFVPPLYEKKLVDEIIPIEGLLAEKKVANLAKQGLFLGISSGAAILGAEKIAQEHPSKIILAISPDGGNKYMSSGIYGDK
jgi:cysteine synthase A